MRSSKVDQLLGTAPKGERIQTSLKINKSLYEEIQAICSERGITASALVEASLEDTLAAIRKPARSNTK